MKFSSSSSELQKVLGTVGGVIPSKSTLPILENFLFRLEGNKLNITATDLDISISVTLDVEGSRNGTVAVPAKRMLETIRSLPGVKVTFTVDGDQNRIVMSTPNGEYKLTGESSENYPTVPAFKGDESLDMDEEMIKGLIGRTIFAVSSDELRPAMLGVLFQLRKQGLTVVATDGHRLVRSKTTKVKSGNQEREIIIPAKALNLVLKSVNGKSNRITLSPTHALFAIGDTTLVTRLIEEKYPNYESVIPLDNSKKLIVEKNQLLASVRRTSLYASSTTHQVRFSLKKNSLTVSAEDIDFGSEAHEALECEYASEPLEIGFNSTYIIDVLSHIETDEAVFLFSTPTRASIVQPVKQPDGEDILMLVMPVRLNT
jgi:DNA polymerase III subunit beta